MAGLAARLGDPRASAPSTAPARACARSTTRCPPHTRRVVRDADEMAAASRRLVDAGDIAMVKGSLGSRVGKVVDAIKTHGRGPSQRSARRIGAPMLYYLAELSQNLNSLNVFRYITFRAGGAFFTALVFGFLFGRPLIEMLRVRQGRGQPIRSDGPEGHLITKEGTPTMGGLLILSALLVSTLLWARWSNGYVWMVLSSPLGFGLIGFADDYAKVREQTHAGVSGRARLAAGFVIALVAAAWAMYLHPTELTGQLAFPVFKGFLFDLGWFFIPFAMLVIVGAANAVNLTDGLDGLAIMPVMIAAGSLGIIAYAVGRVDFTEYLGVHYVPEHRRAPDLRRGADRRRPGLSLVQRPAGRGLHGRHRHLALGGALGAIAVATKHEIVLAIIGGLFVVEALSVIIQVLYYKRTKKRVFLMAPIHHHFEKLGWKEPQIVIRFWIVSLILAMVGLATLKLR